MREKAVGEGVVMRFRGAERPDGQVSHVHDVTADLLCRWVELLRRDPGRQEARARGLQAAERQRVRGLVRRGRGGGVRHDRVVKLRAGAGVQEVQVVRAGVEEVIEVSEVQGGEGARGWTRARTSSRS